MVWEKREEQKLEVRGGEGGEREEKGRKVLTISPDKEAMLRGP